MSNQSAPDWAKFLEALKRRELFAPDATGFSSTAAFSVTLVRKALEESMTPAPADAPPPKTVWHYATSSEFSICGETVGASTIKSNEVTCPACLSKMKGASSPASSETIAGGSFSSTPAKTRGQEVAEKCIFREQGIRCPKVMLRTSGVPYVISQCHDVHYADVQVAYLRLQLASLIDAEKENDAEKYLQSVESTIKTTEEIRVIVGHPDQTIASAVKSAIAEARQQQREEDALLVDGVVTETSGAYAARKVAERIREEEATTAPSSRPFGTATCVAEPPERSGPGVEIDAAVAERVMGWKVVRVRGESYADEVYDNGTVRRRWIKADVLPVTLEIWNPSTDITVAMEVWEKIKWKVTPEMRSGIFIGDDIPLAICLAALKVVEEKVAQ